MAETVPSPMLFPLAGRRVYVAGDRGVVGSALVRRLARSGCEVIGWGKDVITRELAQLIAEVVGFKGTFRPDQARRPPAQAPQHFPLQPHWLAA
jgi:GDP-L-fucose synthase